MAVRGQLGPSPPLSNSGEKRKQCKKVTYSPFYRLHTKEFVKALQKPLSSLTLCSESGSVFSSAIDVCISLGLLESPKELTTDLLKSELQLGQLAGLTRIATWCSASFPLHTRRAGCPHKWSLGWSAALGFLTLLCIAMRDCSGLDFGGLKIKCISLEIIEGGHRGWRKDVVLEPERPKSESKPNSPFTVCVALLALSGTCPGVQRYGGSQGCCVITHKHPTAGPAESQQ